MLVWAFVKYKKQSDCKPGSVPHKVCTVSVIYPDLVSPQGSSVLPSGLGGLPS